MTVYFRELCTEANDIILLCGAASRYRVALLAQNLIVQMYNHAQSCLNCWLFVLCNNHAPHNLKLTFILNVLVYTLLSQAT